MSIICPATGHIVSFPTGDFCSDHGVKWFIQCPSCDAMWPAKPSGRYARSSLTSDLLSQTASDFCGSCGKPGPWLSRDALMDWLTHQVQADASVSDANRLELREVLARLQTMDPNDNKAVAGWEQVKKLAPKVWESTKTVRDALLSEAVKKAMGL